MDENEAVTRQTFEKFLQSTDPEVRQWVESLRDAYNQLRNSPDPTFREYWDQQMRYSMDQAAIAQQAKSIANMQEYLSGQSCKVKFGRKWLSGYWHISTAVTCGQFTFAIPQGPELDFEKGDEVIVQFHLADSEHPRKYVRDAQKTDPASRLAVSISDHDKNGNFQAWLTVEKAYKTLCKINTLVDILEGYEYDERRRLNLPRRWYTDSAALKKHNYT